MARVGSSRRKFERELERRSHEALDRLEAALVSDRPERVLLGWLLGSVLAERALYRDVRVELVAAGELLRVPPATIDPVKRRAAFEALHRLADEADRRAVEFEVREGR